MKEDRLYREVELTRAGIDNAKIRERIIQETEVEVYVNGKLYATAMILAGNEKEYAAGLCYSQGVVTSFNDIQSITVETNIVHVELLSDAHHEVKDKGASDFTVSRANVFSSVKAILESPVFRETEAVHSAGIFLEGKKAIAITEDIGRAHAFDKVIGAALLEHIDFSRVLAASTGRIPLEMILKCCNAGIPFIATKGVPTSAAVELAELNNISIAGLVRGRNMVVYCHPERIS